MPLIVLAIVAQVLCGMHVVRTGRETYWVWLVIMAPGIGCAIYFFSQILPDLGNTRTAGQAKKTAVKVLDPMREYRAAAQAFDMVESVENRLRLADSMISLQKLEEAEPHLRQCLQGAHATDPHIMMRLAEVRLELGDPTESLSLLDELQKANPGFQSQDGHMIYARALEASGETEQALESFEALIAYANGEEARVRYGKLLAATNQAEQAAVVFEEVIKRVDRGTKFYRKAQKSWRREAEHALQRL